MTAPQTTAPHTTALPAPHDGGAPLRARWLASMRDVPAAQWAPLMHGRSFFLSRDWLVGAEDGLTPHPHYLLLDRAGDDTPVAGLPGQVTRGDTYLFYDLPRLLTDPHECAAARGRLTGTEQRELDDAVAALRQRPGHRPTLALAASGMASGLGLRRDLGPERHRVAAAAAAALCAETERLGADVCVLPYLGAGEDPELSAELDRAGFVAGSVAAECVLPVAWDSFDGYLAALPAKRRRMVRHEVRRFRAAGLRTVVGGVADLTDSLAGMQAALRRRYGHDGDDAAIAASYADMRTHLAPYVRVARAIDGSGEVVGFVLFFAADGGYYVKSCGFRYDLLDADFCYFNLVYYALVEAAVRDGVRFIHYGLGSYAAKTARGCVVRELVVRARFTGPDEESLRRLLALHTRARARELAGCTGGQGDLP